MTSPAVTSSPVMTSPAVTSSPVMTSPAVTSSSSDPVSSPMPPSPTPPPAPTSPPGFPPHPMVTRARAGIFKPRQFLNLSASSHLSPLPRSHTQAIRDPNWKSAMEDELRALHSNSTWDLVPPPPGVNLVGSKWVFRHKFRSDGSLERYKARLVAQGYSQLPGIDYDETFSPVVKPATIRTVLSLSLSRQWPIHQLDVKNAFLHGTLSETVYMKQPLGFADSRFPSHVCRLKKALYGLKQAPRAWYHRFSSYISSLGFCSSRADPSLFTLRRGRDMAFLLLYVDDIILTSSSSTFLSSLNSLLSSEFAMTDLGPLHYFLGISVSCSSSGLHLSQSKFAREILSRANMAVQSCLDSR